MYKPDHAITFIEIFSGKDPQKEVQRQNFYKAIGKPVEIKKEIKEPEFWDSIAQRASPTTSTTSSSSRQSKLVAEQQISADLTEEGDEMMNQARRSLRKRKSLETDVFKEKQRLAISLQVKFCKSIFVSKSFVCIV